MPEKKRIISLCIAVVIAVGLTSCVYPENVMFSAHEEELYKSSNAKDFKGITDNNYARGLPDYGDASLNAGFKVDIKYWPKDDGNLDTESLCGGQTIGIAGDYDILPKRENDLPYIDLPVIMKASDDCYYNGVFVHDIQLDEESLVFAGGKSGIHPDGNGHWYAYFSVRFYPLPEGNTQTFTIDYYDNQGNRLPEFSGTLSATFENIKAPPTPTPDDSSSYDDDDSSSTVVVKVPTVPSALTVDESEAKAALAAVKPGETQAAVSHNGSIKVLAQAWEVFGKTPVNFDSVADGAVQVRITVSEPDKLTGDIMLSGFVKGRNVNARKALFERFFLNEIQILHLEQSGSWGTAVEIAAKIDISGTDVENLVFYSYDIQTNTCRQIVSPNAWADKNGYLRFTSSYAGDIVISDGALEAR